jgi:hypothetical protein
MVRRRFDMRTPRKIPGGAGIKSQERKMLNRVLCIAATKSSKPWIDSERKRPSEVFRVKKFNVAPDDGHTRLVMKFGLCRCGELHGRATSACEDDGSLIQVECLVRFAKSRHCHLKNLALPLSAPWNRTGDQAVRRSVFPPTPPLYNRV